MYSRESNHKQAYKEFGTINDPNKPSYLDNLEFLFRYQVGHLYLRYFMWNFAGRQNDIQGHGGVLHGNWISGIKFIDDGLIGSTDKLPALYKDHPARNKYYLLPLILGIIGAIFHYGKSKKDFSVVMMLFILTGIAIVVYLNQKPMEPRERDYAYVASFYAFAIWIGLGVLSIFEFAKKRMPATAGAVIAILISGIAVPSVMTMTARAGIRPVT